MRKGITIVWVTALFAATVTLFWYHSLIYSLPTPVPANYKPVPLGQLITLNSKLITQNARPTFLHFFNPGCPCSRFNISTFKKLAEAYKHRVNFVIVVISSKQYNIEQIKEKFDLQVPVLFDAGTATECGVYSTPQVVLLDAGRKLYYRGNYNRSRFCTDEKTSFAKIAIEGLLANNNHISFDKFALIAYGCQLPGCKKL